MNDLNPRQLKGLFYTIEVNLVLWIAVAWTVWESSAQRSAKLATVGGFIIAALLQHWAYYNLYKRAKQNVRKASPDP